MTMNRSNTNDSFCRPLPGRMAVRATARRVGGFTLIEVILVLSILGVIAGMAVPRLLNRQKYANSDATLLTIEGIEQAIKLYSIDHLGELPTQQAGLLSLVTPPQGKSKQWRGPYLDMLPKDAWGQPIEYRCPGKLHPKGYDLVSAGPDKVMGTEDDLSNQKAP
jgi:general secretion pathway protein G